MVSPEAHEAWEACVMDDKLPEYWGFDVELADAAIRLYDLIGCESQGFDVNSSILHHYNENQRLLTGFALPYCLMMTAPPR